MQPIPPKTDPRKHFKAHKERSYKRFWYTYETIAALLGVKVVSVRKMVTRKLLDPSSLLSVCRAWLRKKGNKTP